MYILFIISYIYIYIYKISYIYIIYTSSYLDNNNNNNNNMLYIFYISPTYPGVQLVFITQLEFSVKKKIHVTSRQLFEVTYALQNHSSEMSGCGECDCHLGRSTRKKNGSYPRGGETEGERENKKKKRGWPLKKSNACILGRWNSGFLVISFNEQPR